MSIFDETEDTAERRQHRAVPYHIKTILQNRVQAHPSEYRGVAFRSALEADFAHFLDQTGIRDWEYEPQPFFNERGAGYLPDFRVRAENGRTVYYEVKPTLAEVPEARRRMEAVWLTEPGALLIVVCAEYNQWFAAVRGGRWQRFAERWRH